MLNLKIKDKDENILFSKSGKNISCEYNSVYNEGDKIEIELSDCEYIKIKIEESLAESIVYVPGKIFEYSIPFGEKRGASNGYDKIKTFSGGEKC